MKARLHTDLKPLLDSDDLVFSVYLFLQLTNFIRIQTLIYTLELFLWQLLSLLIFILL